MASKKDLAEYRAPRVRNRARGWRQGMHLLGACALSLLAVAPALAQKEVRRAESGYIGRGTGTEELESCRKQTDLSEDENRERASEHFERGINLYRQGDYRAAIEEWVLSYCHIPHESTIKNISEAYERLVDYEKAVAYLERYILETPREAESERRTLAAYVEVLRNLSARVSIATEPKRASVTLVGETGVSARGVSNADEPIGVRKGTYVMTIEKEGYETISETIEVKIGKPYSFYYQLQPKKGTLTVVAVPKTATIFIGNSRVGIGTYVNQLPVGRYRVSAEAPGHESAVDEIEITDGSQKTVPLELNRKPRSGRLELLVAASLGGGLAGSSVGALLSDRGEAVGGAGPVGLALGLTAAYIGVPRRIPVGTSSYLIGATSIGAAAGLALASHFVCRPDPDIDCNEEAIIAGSLAGGVTGLLTSALTAGRLDMSAGDAAVINSGAMWGSVAGGLLWVVFDRDPSIAAPLSLAGLGLGTLTGVLLTRRADISRRHMTLIDISGALGMAVSAAIADVADQGEGFGSTVPHFALLGVTVGLIAGTYLTRNMDAPAGLTSVAPSIGAARQADGQTTMTLGFSGGF